MAKPLTPKERAEALPSVEECEERIAQAKVVLDSPWEYDVEVRVQADRDTRRWTLLLSFARALLASEARERELREVAARELEALERWAGEQNAGNAFAGQVRQWAMSKRAALGQEGR